MYYTDDFGNRLHKETIHKHDSNGNEYTETAITSDKPFESGEIAEIMAEYIAEQMVEEMLHPLHEENQQTEQLQGGLDSFDADFMEMLEVMAPMILDDTIDEEEFDAKLEEMFPEENAEDVIESIEEQTKGQQEQAESAFGAGLIDTVIDKVGTIGSNYDDTYDAIISSLSSANIEEEGDDEEFEEDEDYEEDAEIEDAEEDDDEFEGLAEEIAIAQVDQVAIEEADVEIPAAKQQIINPEQAMAENVKSSTSPLWVLTVLFIAALGYGIYLNVFNPEQKGYSRKNKREEGDNEAIRLTTYGTSKKGKRLVD